MLTIEIRSLSGQYHATPWDHQVNEGVVEWPPSPWRLVRALIATWHLKAQHLDAALVESIVSKLASALPRYALPPMVEAHTRHYMPLGDDKTTKIFQSFARIDDEPLLINWPDVDLSDDEHDALATLLRRIGFLGRAESWVEARLVTTSEHAWNSAPLGQLPGDDEIVRVLAPVPPAAYLTWRAETVESIKARELREQQNKDEAKGKAPSKALSKAALKKVEARVPSDILDALCCDTSDLKKAGWSQPPGSQWVEYTRPRHQVEPTLRAYRQSTSRPTVARFAIASAVLPRLTRALGEAEKLHKSLVSWDQSKGPVFTGCDANGTPLSGHEHAHIFPESYDLHGHITHFTVYAEMGFDAAARRALENVRKLWGRKGHDLQLALLGIGQPEDFAGLDTRSGACPLFVESSVWRSRTPFVGTRHIKRRKNGEPKLDERGLEIGGPEHDLRRLLAERGLEPLSIEQTTDTNLGKATRWLAFQTERSTGGGRRGRQHGTGFEITFAEPVRGPIALGYGAHLGLGQFEPVR